MITQQEKDFVKIHADMLSGIYSGKLAELMMEVFQLPSAERDKIIDAVNILKTWLVEIDMIKKGQEIKKTTFV